MADANMKRDVPLEGTHLTELELTEMWYQYCEDMAFQMGSTCHHRAHKRLFPRSRKDLIAYFTQKDLENGRDKAGEVLQIQDSNIPGGESSSGQAESESNDGGLGSDG